MAYLSCAAGKQIPANETGWPSVFWQPQPTGRRSHCTANITSSCNLQGPSSAYSSLISDAGGKAMPHLQGTSWALLLLLGMHMGPSNCGQWEPCQLCSLLGFSWPLPPALALSKTSSASFRFSKQQVASHVTSSHTTMPLTNERPAEGWQSGSSWPGDASARQHACHASGGAMHDIALQLQQDHRHPLKNLPGRGVLQHARTMPGYWHRWVVKAVLITVAKAHTWSSCSVRKPPELNTDPFELFVGL